MASLRELLDKQKREKEAALAKSVLQSQESEKKATEAQGASPAGGNATKQNNVNGTIQGTVPQSPGNNSVVEQGPPAGLTTLQLIKWKRENVQKIPNQTQSVVEKTPEKINEQTVSQAAQLISATKTNINENNSLSVPASASQNADNQKTNDGSLDVAELRRQLKYLAENIEQKELVGQVIRTIAVSLKRNTALTKHMGDGDFDLMVRAMRKTYTVVARKKQEKRDTAKAGKKDDAEFNNLMKDMGLDSLKIF